MGWLEEAAQQAAADQPMPAHALSLVPVVVPGRVLLVDGDYLAYYCAGNDECEQGRARQNAIGRIESMKAAAGCERVVVHLTSPGSDKGGRYIIATVKPYQGKRGNGHPKNWAYLREWMEGYKGELFTTKTWGTREADDGLAYHAAVLGVDKAVIATADKDLRMVPAWHLSWREYTMTRLDQEFAVVGDDGKLYGHKWFWMQVLQGDGADDIPGLPKYVDAAGKVKLMGEKTAEKFLAQATNNKEAITVVAALYRTFYKEGWPERLVEQMALLWMRRDRDADILDVMDVVAADCGFYPSVYNAVEGLIARVEQAKQEAAAIGPA